MELGQYLDEGFEVREEHTEKSIGGRLIKGFGCAWRSRMPGLSTYRRPLLCVSDPQVSAMNALSAKGIPARIDCDSTIGHARETENERKCKHGKARVCMYRMALVEHAT